MSKTEERPVSDNTAEREQEKEREIEIEIKRKGEKETEEPREERRDTRRGTLAEGKRERRRKRERVEETKGERNEFSGEEHSSFSLFLSLLSARAGKREARPKDEELCKKRDETGRIPRDKRRRGRCGGDGGTAGQKRITRVITTLINK